MAVIVVDRSIAVRWFLPVAGDEPDDIYSNLSPPRTRRKTRTEFFRLPPRAVRSRRRRWLQNDWFRLDVSECQLVCKGENVVDRYAAQGPEAEFEPGSRGRVLRNLLGIRSVREMARLESEALLAATQQLINETRLGQRFTTNDICRIHRLWLGEIYSWAGQYRSTEATDR